jgi:hypothetical protein
MNTTPFDWEIECPELRLPPEGHVYRVVPTFRVGWPPEHHY